MTVKRAATAQPVGKPQFSLREKEGRRGMGMRMRGGGQDETAKAATLSPIENATDWTPSSFGGTIVW